MPLPSKYGAPGLTRRSDGRFVLDLKVRGKERYRETFPEGTNAKVAKARAIAIYNGLRDGTAIPLRKGETEVAITLRASFDRHLASLESRGILSLKNRRAHLKSWVAFLPEDPAKITPKLLGEYVARAHKSTLSNATINRHLASLKVWAKWARSQGEIDIAIFAEVRAYSLLREPPGRVRSLSQDEERAFFETLNALDLDMARVVTVAILTGMRRSEITSMKWSQCDLQAREIRLHRTKSNKVRVLPVSDDLLAMLVPLDRSTEYALPLDIGPGRGRPVLERRAEHATRAFSQVRKAAGIDDLRLHDMRHDFATRARRAGVGLDVLQRLMGHSTIAMTTRYAHVGDAAMRAAMSAVRLNPRMTRDESESATKQGEKVT